LNDDAVGWTTQIQKRVGRDGFSESCETPIAVSHGQHGTNPGSDSGFLQKLAPGRHAARV
jgi:hypothetical protein